MKRISSIQFQKNIKENPAWAATLTEPVQVTGGAGLNGSPITHLSPLLHFYPIKGQTRAAAFWNCPNLKVAQGTFHGWVQFAFSGIEEIDPENLIIRNTGNTAAIFYKCAALKVAQGNFPGHVKFKKSGIQKFGEITLQTRWPGRRRIDLTECDDLKSAPQEILTGPGLIIDEPTKERLLRQLTRETLMGKNTELIEL